MVTLTIIKSYIGLRNVCQVEAATLASSYICTQTSANLFADKVHVTVCLQTRLLCKWRPTMASPSLQICLICLQIRICANRDQLVLVLFTNKVFVCKQQCLLLLFVNKLLSFANKISFANKAFCLQTRTFCKRGPTYMLAPVRSHPPYAHKLRNLMSSVSSRRLL